MPRNLQHHRIICGLLLGAATVSPAFGEEAAPAKDEHDLIAALKSGKPIIDVRYRYELRDQDDFAEEAYAHTVRTRFGYETGEFYNFKLLVEGENVFSIGEEQFNSTTNGLIQYPIIADPDALEVNRAQVTFTGIKNTAISVGRQRFNLANQRFVGAVDFRQNEQTFDAARLTVELVPNLTADYAYVRRVHRIFGDDNPLGEFKGDTHILAAVYDGKKAGKLTAYGLLLDFENAPGSSSATWGARYENTVTLEESAGLKFGIVGEYARQRDYATSPLDYEEHYAHGEAALHVRGATLRLGYERLGGDGTAAFQTPLATLHKFQGHADVFLTTPAEGIEDLYGTASYNWKDAPFGTSITVYATYHDYEEERGDESLGEEIDAGIQFAFTKNFSAEIAGAHYKGNATLADRNFLWASLRFQY
jgi:hypothetical protein